MRLHPKRYKEKEFTEKGPDRELMRAILVQKAEAEINHFFRWKNKPAREKYVEENLAAQYDAALEAWQRRRDAFYAEEERKKQIFEEEARKEYEKKREPLVWQLSQDPGVISAALSTETNTLDIPGEFGLDFFLDNGFRVVYVDVDLPEVVSIPTTKTIPWYAEPGSAPRKTLKEIQQEYIRFICGTAFYIAGRFFNANTGIEYIQVSGYTQRLNRSVGELKDEDVLSVFFDRESFSQLRVEAMDPTVAIMDYPVCIKPSVRGILLPIEPFPAPGDEGFVRGFFPRREIPKIETGPDPVRPVIQPLYTPEAAGFMSTPAAGELSRPSAGAIYPTARVRFEGREVLGEVFENVIRRIPQYDFGVGAVAQNYKKNPRLLRRDLREVYRLQEHFKSVLDAIAEFEKEGNYEKVCYHCEQLLFEKYYDPAPIDKLIRLYGQANLLKSKKEVLTEAISHFKALRQSRELYVNLLSDKCGLPGIADSYIQHGKTIMYFDNAFELYNPFPIISNWESQLRSLERVITEDMYKQDLGLPSHGRHAKADNEGTVRVRITRRSGFVSLVESNGFELFLNVRPSDRTYHATLETEEDLMGKKQVLDIEVPSKVVEEIVDISFNKAFMSLKDDDIFNGVMIQDGYDVTLSVRTDAGSLTLNNGLLDDTLRTGLIDVKDGTIQTPFHRLAAIAFETLGIEPEKYEEEEE